MTMFQNRDIIAQPEMLQAALKEYQGLNWLAELYEQGINGILSDEMVTASFNFSTNCGLFSAPRLSERRFNHSSRWTQPPI